MDDETRSLINYHLSSKIRDLLIEEQPNGEYKLKGENFQNALRRCHGDEANAVIEIFLREIAQDQLNVDFDKKIAPIKDILIRICNEVGLRESENPFLPFLKEYLKKYTLDRDSLIDLNNLYASDELSYEDIVGKSKEGFNHIIFNPFLYSCKDPYKMVQIYNWLSNPKNLASMNWTEVAKAGLSNKITSLATRLAKMNQKDITANASEYRDELIYEDSGNPTTSPINNQNTIEEILRLGSINSNAKAQIKDVKKATDTAKTGDALKQAIVDLGDKYGLSKLELQAIWQDAMNELGY